jgi:hypothetical protein
LKSWRGNSQVQILICRITLQLLMSGVAQKDPMQSGTGTLGRRGGYHSVLNTHHHIGETDGSPFGRHHADRM